MTPEDDDGYFDDLDNLEMPPISSYECVMIRKERYKEIMETIDSQAAQISELKEKLLLATAKVVAYDNVAATPEEAAECGCILGHPFESYPQRWQDYWTDKARQQLKADPDLQKAGVEWE
jgi:hypothetical protein